MSQCFKVSRREFLQTVSAVTTASMVGGRTVQGKTLPRIGRRGHILVPSAGRWSDPDLQILGAAALEAARSAGASYADVRFTDTEMQGALGNSPPYQRGEDLAVGVRVLVNGYWGFQGSTAWTTDEVVRLARDAVAQARANGMGGSRPLDLGPPQRATGEWVMPVKYDPFDVPLTEIMDFFNYALATVQHHAADLVAFAVVNFTRQRKVFASTDGAAWSQTTYVTSGEFTVVYHADYTRQLPISRFSADFLSPAGKGWEHISESGLIEAIPRLVDEAEQARHTTPVAVDRYDAVFSAEAMASLLDGTIGAATELDRAMGYEANASGTSYLDQPLEMLGTYRVGSPLVNVSANRSLPGGVATVRWDDESVVPDEFTVVRNGTLADFQTTREQVAWIAPYYAKTHHPARSHGCAGAESALSVTMQQPPNVQLEPSTSGPSFEQLVASVKNGVAVMSMGPNMDQQQLNGVGYGTIRKIVNGKLGPYIDGAGVQFRSTDIWKRVVALGGAGEHRWFGMGRAKGQPNQVTMYSVGAVPARIDHVDIIDIKKKA